MVKLLTALLLCACLIATAVVLSSCGGDDATEGTEETTVAEETTAAETAEPKITGFEVTTPPTKTVYNVGEELDLTGMVCTLTYDNGTTEVTDKYKTTQTGALGTADSTITIRYNTRFKDTFEITVNLNINLPGTGTAEDPYIISTPEDFVTFQAILAEGEKCSGKYFVLANDITITDASAYKHFSQERQSIFDGILDGRGHVLKAVLPSKCSENFSIPFFYYVTGTILNTGFDITQNGTTGTAYAVARELDGADGSTSAESGMMINCYVVGSMICENSSTSIIAGTTQGAKVSNVFVNVSISGTAPSTSSSGVTIKGTNEVTNAYYVANGCVAQYKETEVTDTTTVAEALNATLADAAAVAGLDASALCTWTTDANGSPVLVAK